jgi:hypothetical protein
VSNIEQFPNKDMVAGMVGPARTGCAVIIDGRVIPNMVMYDKGAIIEFVIDGRLSFDIPRESAYTAASFAAAAMAIGAGFAHPSAMHFTQRPFAPQVMQLGELPSG